MREGYHVVFRSTMRSECAERALVLQSREIPCEIDREGRDFFLLVREEHAADASEELRLYARENRDWQRTSPRPTFEHREGWPGSLAYLIVVCLVAWLAGSQALELDWFGAGKLDAGRVLSGEWWRAVTALTLHLDLGHITANLVFGVVLGFFAGQYLGAGVAWLTILGSGVLGNLLNAWLQAPTHTAVGASTAIFGALGLVAAFAWRLRLYPQDRWAYRWGPVIGGVALLTYTGTGDERTDVGAHLTGFIAGFLLGLLYAYVYPRLPRTRALQWAAGAAALAVIAGAWAAAFALPA